jgi:EAL domain-containing protein (putative c-di-GMP-specific phosphodiesterase class I)
MSDKSFRLAPSDIDMAFERNEFRIVFQPKVDLASERITGAEVFVRWQHPQYGLLPPGLFLDFIEAQGRMADMTGFVFHAALEGAKKWKALGHDWAVSINVSPGTVTAPGFAEGLGQLIEEYGLEPDRVIIEVPERAVVQEPEVLCESLLSVRKIGVHVALDGGGIVPVDLSQFVPMPFTSIKVGGPASIRLAQRLGAKGKGAIATRLRFAHQFELEAVAVGAEDEATMAGLAGIGFTAAQGVWIQKPLTLDELLDWDGKWARGNAAMDTPPVAPRAVVQPQGEQVPPVAPEFAAPPPPPKSLFAKPGAMPVVSKEDMQRALEAVRARRSLQAKPEQKETPPLPVLDTSDLEDVLEDEEVMDAPVKREGLGALSGANCPPMKSLVQRRTAKGETDVASRKTDAV